MLVSCFTFCEDEATGGFLSCDRHRIYLDQIASLLSTEDSMVGVWKTSSQESADFHNSNFNTNNLLFDLYIGILFPMLPLPTPVLQLYYRLTSYCSKVDYYILNMAMPVNQ